LGGYDCGGRARNIRRGKREKGEEAKREREDFST
jgi:hypothetical protein